MLSTRFTKLIKGFVLVSAMVFGVILVSSSAVSAQDRGYRNDDRYDRNDDRYDRNDNRYDRDDDDRYNGRDRNGNQSVRFAYRQGYQAGLKQGRRDARNRYGNGGYYGGYGNTGSYDQYGNYGRNGNRNGWANNSAWRQAYQSGFNRGYQDALNRYRGNRNNGRVIRLPF